MREGKQGRTSHRDYPNNSLEYKMPVYGRKRYTMANPIRDNLRNRYMTAVREFLTQAGEEVLETNSNEFAIPCVDEKGNDEFIVVSFKIPVGSRDGDPYDGYSMAEDYAMKKAMYLFEKCGCSYTNNFDMMMTCMKCPTCRESAVGSNPM